MALTTDALVTVAGADSTALEVDALMNPTRAKTLATAGDVRMAYVLVNLRTFGPLEECRGPLEGFDSGYRVDPCED